MIAVAAASVAVAVALALAAASGGTPARRPLPLPSAEHPEKHHRRSTRNWRRARRVVQPTELAAWSDDLSRALRHGSTLHAALTKTVPTDVVIANRSASIRHWLDRGATVAEACDEWAEDLTEAAPHRRRNRERNELLIAMATVLGATATLGGPAAAPLDRFAVTMRQRASDELERAAHSAQAKMSARVLTSVPIAVLVLLVATDDDVRTVIATATGGGVVALGLALNTVGALWMRRVASGSGSGSGAAGSC